MLIILCVYLVAVWLIFSRLKLISFGWGSGSIVVVLGIAICAVFLGLFNYLTPSGRITVVAPVIEITPNVSGEVVDIPVRPNVPVKAGAVLFRIDPTPFQFKVNQLQAALVSAQQQAKVLQANYDQATVTVNGLKEQLAFHTKRLADIDKLMKSGVDTPFREQDTRNQYEVVAFQLQAAEQSQRSARLSLDSQIDGINTTVLQTQAQLDQAKWELAQTTVRAVADGIATAIALTPGDRALQARSVMTLVLSNDVKIVGMFSQNGFQTVKPSAPVKLIFDNDPGRYHLAEITDVLPGIGQGQVAVSGQLARTNAIGGATTYPALISVPSSIDRVILRPGMSGSATAFAKNAGVIGLLADILVWISAYLAYL